MKNSDTRKLKDYFKNHFNPPATSSVQIELINAPKCLKELQSLCDTELNTDPPSKEEIIAVIKSLKNGKSANDISARNKLLALAGQEKIWQEVLVHGATPLNM